MSLFIAAAVLVAATPAPVPAAYAMSLRCAVTDAVVAGILGGGEANDSDRQAAARFQEMSERWLHQAVTASPDGADTALADFQRETRALTASLATSADPSSVQSVLEGRLDGCEDPASATEDAPDDTNNAEGTNIA